MNLLAALASVRIFPRKASHQTLTTRWGKALDPQHILEEYPRPQMIRDQYINLNGEWNYTVLSEKNTITKEGTLLVPFSPEAPLSGAGFHLNVQAAAPHVMYQLRGQFNIVLALQSVDVLQKLIIGQRHNLVFITGIAQQILQFHLFRVIGEW